MTDNRLQTRALAEPTTFALLQWPAMLGLLTIDPGRGGWWLAARIAVGLWLLAMAVAAYRGGRGVGFGNAMLLQNALVAAAWWSHPSVWVFACLAGLLLVMLVAQRLRLRADG